MSLTTTVKQWFCKEFKLNFKFNFTAKHLRILIPENQEYQEWFDDMNCVLPKYSIVTIERVAGFIAQCAHESNNFRTLEENLNYSEEALLRVFPRYFGNGKINAADYARNPEKIANYVYMDQNRMSRSALGNVNPGDGWKFRGRGLKQLTGRSNYAAFGKTVGMTAEQAVDYVATKKGALESACWFWQSADCNSFADRFDIVGMSRRINGGTIGLEDRQRRWDQALGLFNGEYEKVFGTIRTGSRGVTVRLVQEELGLNNDGAFGSNTARAIKTWQLVNGLSPTGELGPSSIAKVLKLCSQ